MMKRFKIIHVLQSLEVGGLENGVVNIANHLNADEFETVICCIRRLGFNEARLKPGVKTICLHEKEGYSFGRIACLYRIFKHEAPDVVHTHGWGSDYFSSVIAARLAGVPRVVNGEHGVFYFDKPLRVLAQKILPYFVDKMLTVSFSLRDDLIVKLKISPEKILPIINGVDTEKFMPDADARQRVRSVLGVADADILVGSVGRLVPVKNYELLIAAAHTLCDRFQNLKFVFVGDGPLRKDLESKAGKLKEQGRIIFVGNTDRAADYLNALDIFALTSFTEGLSNTILEAMACGKPVIASDVGDNGILVKNGENGFIFASGDLDGLIKKITSLIAQSELRSRLAHNSRSSVVSHYSLAAMINNYTQFYHSLISS